MSLKPEKSYGKIPFFYPTLRRRTYSSPNVVNSKHRYHGVMKVTNLIPPLSFLTLLCFVLGLVSIFIHCDSLLHVNQLLLDALRRLLPSFLVSIRFYYGRTITEIRLRNRMGCSIYCDRWLCYFEDSHG